MKKNICSKAILLASLFLLSVGTMTASCTSKNDTRQEETVSAESKGEKDGKIIHITAEYMREHIYDYTANPQEWVYKGDKPAIIDFYADWCGPCHSLSPKLEEVAKKYAGKLTVYKVDVDKEKELAGIFGVRSIPMVLFVPVKGIPTQTMGNLPMENIEEAIAKIMQSDL
ncbi:thioredoxin family protein [Porphyromonas gingivalis]|uniref:thioredoxin family protein n=1 Tax=Porphyromonas gingivalis TaxID=837 RepID=UPI000974FAB4|nr:thioredoxin domain-containing protein [Porphyromonas gingivalis]SJL23095.1 thiol reductase thioredoxin [Porphyromonas gingivalis]